MTVSDKKIRQILALSNEGFSDHAISKKLKVDNHTVKKYKLGQIIPKPKLSSTQISHQESDFGDDRCFNDDSHGFPQEHSQMREHKKQSDNLFTSPKDLREETHISFSKWTVGDRPVSEFLRKPLDRSSETISRPPLRTYGDFIPVPRIKKPEPQISDLYDKFSEVKKLIREKEARNKKIVIAGMDRRVRRLEEINRIEEEARSEREQIQKNEDITRKEEKKVSQLRDEPIPESKPEPKPEKRPSFEELMSRLTGDINGDYKIIDDDAQHLDIFDRGELFTEHLRLFYGGEK